MKITQILTFMLTTLTYFVGLAITFSAFLEKELIFSLALGVIGFGTMSGGVIGMKQVKRQILAEMEA